MTIYHLPTLSYKDITYREVYPLQLENTFLYIFIIVTMIFASLAFIVYIVKSTFKKEEAIFGGMLGYWTKFHFIPLLIAGGLFIIGIYCDDNNIVSSNKLKGANIAGLILDVLGLACLIYIYIKTDLPGDWFSALIKKGAYSSLISLEWYYFCYLMYNLAVYNNENDILTTKKNCGITMPIIEGVVALVFAFFFKDVIIALMNVLIFIGAAVHYLSITSSLRFGGHEDAEGIIDIIFAVLSLVVVVSLISLKKKECLK